MKRSISSSIVLLTLLILSFVVQPQTAPPTQPDCRFTFADDIQSPTITLLSPQNESVVQPFSWIEMEIVDDVNISHVLYHWDLIENDTLSAPYALMARTSEVGHYLYVYANDTSNNWASALFYFISDGTDPSISLVSPGENYTAISGTEVNLTVTDLHLDTVRISWDNDDNTTITGPYSTHYPAGDGPHLLQVYANDSAGNVATEMYQFVTDDEAPIIVSNPSNSSVMKGNASLTISIDDASFDSAIYHWDSDSNLTSLEPIFYTSVPIDEGPHTLRISANDSLGRSSEATLIYQTDNTPPNISLSNWINNSLIAAEDIGFFHVVDFNLESVWYIWDENVAVPYGTGVKPPLADGLHFLRAFANDSAGNIALETFAFHIDAQNPRLQAPDVQNPYEVVVNSTEYIELIWIAEDEYADNYVILMNGTIIQSGPWTSGTAIILNVNPDNLGTFNYTILVYDQIGRVSVNEVQVIVIPDNSTIGLLELVIPIFVILSASAVVSAIAIVLIVKQREQMKKSRA